MSSVGKVLRILGPLLLAASVTVPAAAQDLPDGDGKNVVLKVCGSCHGVDYVTNLKHSKAEWQTVVDQMIGYGATATDQEVETIVNYLTKYFGPAKLERASRYPVRLQKESGYSSIYPSKTR